MPETRIVPKREYQIEQKWKWIAIIASIVAVFALVSKWFEPHPLYIMSAAAVIIAYFVVDYFRKRVVEEDAYKIVQNIEKQHHSKYVGTEENPLDTSKHYAWEVVPGISFVEFPNDGITFKYRQGRVVGFMVSGLREALSKFEKSELTKDVLKAASREEKMRAALQAQGLEIPGLEKEED